MTLFTLTADLQRLNSSRYISFARNRWPYNVLMPSALWLTVVALLFLSNVGVRTAQAEEVFCLMMALRQRLITEQALTV